MEFHQTQFDPDVYMRSNSDDTGYDYSGVHTDDVTCVSDDPQGIMDELMRTYELSKVGEPTYHLGCDYQKLAEDGIDYWDIRSSTNCKEAIIKFETLIRNYLNEGKIESEMTPYTLSEYTVASEKQIPMPNGSHPESDESSVLRASGHTLYMQLIGMMQWLIVIGRAGIQYAIMSLSRFSACPQKSQLDANQD